MTAKPPGQLDLLADLADLGAVAAPRPRNRASRKTDPSTSADAERRINASGRRDSQAQRVLRLVVAHPGRTSHELGERYRSAHGGENGRYTVARRLPDLEKLGYVEKAPRRVCTVTGYGAVTWRPTQAGKDWAQG